MSPREAAAIWLMKFGTERVLIKEALSVGVDTLVSLIGADYVAQCRGTSSELLCYLTEVGLAAIKGDDHESS